MKYLYLDAFSGLSGNMFIGALIDLGLKLPDLKTELKKINLSGYELQSEKQAESAIFGTLFNVKLKNDFGTQDQGFDENKIKQTHSHAHVRHLTEIINLIRKSSLKENVKQHAINIFNDIGRAEAKAHNLPLKEVHFHEVGATDSIIDIVGSCIALDLMGVDKVIASSIADGHGFIQVAHGQMPVPVPAVANMLVDSGVPLHQRTDVNTELLTPTGLGIAKEFVSEYRPLDAEDNITKVGYGFGTRKTGSFNALRVFLCDTSLSQQIIKKKMIE